MENRERDKMDKNTQSTGSNANNDPSSSTGKDKKDSSADFGQKTGRPEELKEPRDSGGNPSTGNRK